jgi:hypothetical protein
MRSRQSSALIVEHFSIVLWTSVSALVARSLGRRLSVISQLSDFSWLPYVSYVGWLLSDLEFVVDLSPDFVSVRSLILIDRYIIL